MCDFVLQVLSLETASVSFIKNHVRIATLKHVFFFALLQFVKPQNVPMGSSGPQRATKTSRFKRPAAFFYAGNVVLPRLYFLRRGQRRAQQLGHNEAFRHLFSHHVAPAPVCSRQMFHVFPPKASAAKTGDDRQQSGRLHC